MEGRLSLFWIPSKNSLSMFEVLKKAHLSSFGILRKDHLSLFWLIFFCHGINIKSSTIQHLHQVFQNQQFSFLASALVILVFLFFLILLYKLLMLYHRDFEGMLNIEAIS